MMPMGFAVHTFVITSQLHSFHSSFLPLSLLLSFSPSRLPFLPFIIYLWSTNYVLVKVSTCIQWDI